MAKKQLAQLRPSTTAVQSIYSPPGTGAIEVFAIQMLVVNPSAVKVNYRIFQDADGTTYNEGTALYWDKSIDPNRSTTLAIGPMSNVNGNIAVQVSAASTITFTLIGTERSG